MKKKIFILFIFIFMLFSVASCSSSDEESILIESISSEVLSDGRTQITIKYQNEDMKDSVFYLPKGKDGTGIEDFVYKIDTEKNTTDITFSFTDVLNDYTVSVPNGRGISNVIYTQDEAGDTLMTFVFTDGTRSEAVKVKKGEIGTSLIGFDPVINEDGSVDIKFIYSDGSEYIAKVPAPQKGDTGRGIDSIVSEKTDLAWQLYLFYNDGTFEVVEFERPATILSGTNPSDDEGIDGDLFYDTATKTLYNKADGVWNRIIQFDDDTVKYTVSFNLNCNDSTAALHGKSQITVKKNSYLPASSIPNPTRDGYVFDGWYLEEEPNINNGNFTDLTLITKDLVLYAKWIEE